MNNLTGIIIAKNEEQVIEECIESISFCDEIIVVDNHSSDKTVSTARKKGVTIVNSNADSFSELRNEGLRHATNEWVLYIDADERVSETLKEEIQKTIIKKTGEYSAYTILRKNFYLGNHEWPTKERLKRLFKKNKLEKWTGKLHESPVVNGRVGVLNGEVLHYTHRNLEYMLEKTILWSDVEAGLRFNAKHPIMSWWRFFRVMTTTFFDYFISQKGWKMGTVGLIESMYQMFSIFITYAKLWELQTTKNRVYEKSH